MAQKFLLITIYCMSKNVYAVEDDQGTTNTIRIRQHVHHDRQAIHIYI